MEKITPTELRGNIYNIIDRVIETGEPCEIVRGSQSVILSKPVEKKVKAKKNKIINNLSKIVPLLDAMVEPPEYYIHLKWDDWQPMLDV